MRSLAPSADGKVLSGSLDRHVKKCLGCQAEMARYAKLRRHLAALAVVTDPAPESIVAGVQRAIGSVISESEPEERRAHRARVAATAGAAAAAAAGAVALAVWRQSRAATS